MDHTQSTLRLAEGLWLHQEPGADRALVLRRHLALLANCAEGEVAIARTPLGKPYLAQPVSELFFSTAERGGLMALAAHWDGPVGVDLELLPVEEWDEPVARAFFSPDEAGWLASLAAPSARRLGFFRLWTAKEAVLKGTGDGIANGMAEPDFSPVVKAGEALERPFTTLEFRGRRWDIDWFFAESVLGPALIARAVGGTGDDDKKRTL